MSQRNAAKAAVIAREQQKKSRLQLITLLTLGVGLILTWFALSTFAKAEEVAETQSGNYTLDPTHTSVIFRVNHLGFSPFAGSFDLTEGSMTFDADNPENSSVSITLKSESVDTNSKHLDDGLKGEKMFDAANHPDITFVATSIEKTGDNTGKITGDLTIKGVTKPVTLETTFVGSGVHPYSKLFTMGFYGKTEITRSEFGLNEWLPGDAGMGVADKVTLKIAAEFSKAEEAQATE